jgi:hypothetical protein
LRQKHPYEHVVRLLELELMLNEGRESRFERSAARRELGDRALNIVLDVGQEVVASLWPPPAGTIPAGPAGVRTSTS